MPRKWNNEQNETTEYCYIIIAVAAMCFIYYTMFCIALCHLERIGY